MIKKLLPACLLAMLTACGLHSARMTDVAPALNQPGLDAAELDALITRYVKDNDLVGLSVGVMHKGKVVLAKGYGMASLATHTPVTPDTLFAIGSVSKQFTCASVLLLAEDHQLSMSDHVAKYDTKLNHANDITLLELGQHVSGWPDYYPLDFVDARIAQARPADAIVHDYGNRKLDFAPRSHWSYSNTGFLFLHRVVERVSGEPFGKFLKQRIFQPLGMRHSDYELAAGDARAAQGYHTFGLSAPEPAGYEGKGWLGGAGGIWSTPSDLLAWDLALMDGKMLSKNSYRTMTTPRRLPDGRSTGYGCGQGVKEDGPALVLRHSGAVSGFRANNTFVPATRSGLVLLANVDFAVLTPLREAILKKLLPLGDVPAIRGLSAQDAVRAFLRSLRDRKVDRANLGEEFNGYLDDGKIASAAATLARQQPVDFETPDLSERGGMEVSRTNFKLGRQAMEALMYRTPDGKVQQFLFYRQ